MQIKCNKCDKEYSIESSQIPDKGAKVTCAACGNQFIVRKRSEKKKAKEEPERKTPPCTTCGAPSTHVMAGEPPQPLCERCFALQKETQQRFFSSKQSPDLDATQFHTQKKPGLIETPVQPDPLDQTVVHKPAPAKQDAEFFDSFDEVPDMDGLDAFEDVGTQDAAPAESWSKPAQTESLDPSKPQSEAEASPAFDDPFAAQEESKAAPADKQDMEDFGFSSDEDDMFVKPDESEKPKPAHTRQSDLLSEMEREVEDKIPGTPKPAAIDEMQIPIKKPARSAASQRSRWPAYLIILFIVILAALATGYVVLSYLKPADGQSPTEIPIAETEDRKIIVEDEVTKPQSADARAEKDRKKKELALEKIQSKLSRANELFLMDTVNAYQDAIKQLESALKLDPENAEAQVFLAEIYAFYASLQRSGMNADAQNILDQANQPLRENQRYDRALAHVLINDEQISSAQKILLSHLREYPDDGVAHYLMGVTYVRAAKPDPAKAVASFQKSLEHMPKLTRTYSELGDFYLEYNKLEEALTWHKEALRRSPKKQDAKQSVDEITLAIEQKKREEEESIPLDEEFTAPSAGRSEDLYIYSGDVVMEDIKQIIAEVSAPLSRVPKPTKARQPSSYPSRGRRELPPDEAPK